MSAVKKPLKRSRKRMVAKGLGDRGLPIWPEGKPIPRFKTEAEEVKFWNTYDFEPGPAEAWDEVVYEPSVTSPPCLS